MNEADELREALATVGVERIDGVWTWRHASGYRNAAPSAKEAAAALLRSYWLHYESSQKSHESA